MAPWRRYSGPRGSIEHPESALNLRLVLAIFGAVVSAGCAVLAAIADFTVWAIVFGALAVIAVLDAVVVQYRRRQRGGQHSLFE